MTVSQHADLSSNRSALLKVCAGDQLWEESDGERLPVCVCASQAALASQQRSTGYVLHYVKDLQLFAAAEAAAVGAFGGISGMDEQEMLPPGASEDLMYRLHRASNGAPAASQQQTSRTDSFKDTSSSQPPTIDARTRSAACR